MKKIGILFLLALTILSSKSAFADRAGMSAVFRVQVAPLIPVATYGSDKEEAIKSLVKTCDFVAKANFDQGAFLVAIEQVAYHSNPGGDTYIQGGCAIGVSRDTSEISSVAPMGFGLQEQDSLEPIGQIDWSKIRNYLK